jgi:hypothetical protein
MEKKNLNVRYIQVVIHYFTHSWNTQLLIARLESSKNMPSLHCIICPFLPRDTTVEKRRLEGTYVGEFNHAKIKHTS